ncbi:AbrB/MazE/SpoVT family DNA-binding domain-containing protein [Pseudogemmobacter bohemicus]|uniref:AbrB/MazE/SpoVT family DNA-binding domain-containing protein n=1 Tax=Pseudogemmobacter bohemicus TaxID=2250708 RepID=UPI000DD450C9|nr:type II toxin-antitoxin system PrlF family antitoxin [Pseudogemmobacter bohemicus]
MQESTVTTKGQTTLPRDVRLALRLTPGDRLRYMILDNGEVRIVRSQPVSGLKGLLQGKTQRVVSLDEMEAAIAKGASGQ